MFESLANMFDVTATFLTDPANVGSVVAAGGSALFAVLSFVSQHRASRKAQETERRLELMQSEGLRGSLDAQIIRWGSAVIELLADAERLSRSRTRFTSPTAYEDARDALVSRISAHVDQGRLFFPNVSHDLVGLDRPFANRGFRPPILDAIMLVHERLRRLRFDVPADALDRDGEAFFSARRAFVSELQRALDPRRRDLVFANILGNSKLSASGEDVEWDSVAPLVTAFEAEHGAGTFWREPPRPRHQILGP